jgi:hypothetical protein
MTRRGFIGLPATAAVAARERDDFEGRLAAHCNSLLAFVRKYHGCDPSETDISNCKPFKGQTDYAEFRRSRETAKQLFDLREK